MLISHHAARYIMASAVALSFLTTACADNVVPTAPVSASLVSSALASELGRGGFSFTPLASSFACTVSGGDAVNPVSLPTGFEQDIIASEPSFADAPDMNTQNENGPQAGRYLYRPSEGSISEVSVTDLKTNTTKRFAFRPDWESMDPTVWTPWGTLLVGEEANVATKPDPDYPNERAFRILCPVSQRGEQARGNFVHHAQLQEHVDGSHNPVAVVIGLRGPVQVDEIHDKG